MQEKKKEALSEIAKQRTILINRKKAVNDAKNQLEAIKNAEDLLKEKQQALNAQKEQLLLKLLKLSLHYPVQKIKILKTIKKINKPARKDQHY